MRYIVAKRKLLRKLEQLVAVRYLTNNNLELIKEEEDDEEKADMGGKGQSVTSEEQWKAVGAQKRVTQVLRQATKKLQVEHNYEIEVENKVTMIVKKNQQIALEEDARSPENDTTSRNTVGHQIDHEHSLQWQEALPERGAA